MTTKQEISKEIVVKAIIDSIKKEHENPDIRALYVNGYKEPNKIITKENGEQGFTPDVIYTNEDSTEVYEIELDKKVKLSKWKSFSLFSKKENGNLNIVTHEEYVPHFRELLKTNNIKNAKLIYF
jgi:hypothetical protein